MIWLDYISGLNANKLQIKEICNKDEQRKP